MNDQEELNSLIVSDRVNHFLVLTKVEIKTTRNNKPYLNLELRDASAVMPAKIWDDFELFQSLVSEGQVVKVEGNIEEFSGQRQIKIDNIRIAGKKDKVSPEDFLPKSKRDLNEMLEELKSRRNKIENTYLKELIDLILTGEKFEKYIQVPAGKSWHHSYIHGLLEHTLEIIKICDLMCDFHEELNRDLLISGAILHDFGKTEELKTTPTFDYTDKGRLIGHIVIASMEIEQQAKKIEGFPGELKNQLVHLVLSHQGKLEYASPVEPKTIEAIVLYQADELSAKANAYKYAIKAEGETDNNWTRFLPLANTSLYIPPKENEDDFTETLF